MASRCPFDIICSSIVVGLTISTCPSIALEFPGTCVTPTATVTQITGLDTRNARMEGRYTLPDIIEACYEGYVDQAKFPPNVCIERHGKLTESPPLHASADCVAGFVTVAGLRTKLPAREDCASECVARAVGNADGVIKVLGADDGNHRSKEFFLRAWMIGRNIRKHCRRNIRAGE